MATDKYDSFYFIHIHKTAGDFFFKFILPSLVPILQKNNLKLHNLNTSYLDKEYNTHEGWHPNISDKTYITTFFREPVSQLVSFYLENTKKGETDIFKIKKNFIRYLYDLHHENYIFNNQSKNFFRSKVLDYNTPIDSFTIDNVIKKIDRINRIYTLDKQIIVKEFLYNFTSDIGHPIPMSDFHSPIHKTNPKSLELYNSLSKKDIEYIESKCKIDIAAYEYIKNEKNKLFKSY